MTVPTKLDRLRELALDQHGFVTAAQAVDDGVTSAELSMLTSRGRLERVAHGVYRVPQTPVSEFDQYALAVLWTGTTEACLSHDTALVVWGISDLNPDRIHLTVGRARRLRRAGGEHYVIHHENLDASQRTWQDGIPIASVPTAIDQCIRSGVPTYLVRQAIERAGRTSLLPVPARARLIAELEARDARP